MAEKCAPLLEWFQKNNGVLHQSLSFNYDVDNGYHFIAKEALPKRSTICVCPFPLTLSHLNLLSDPPAGIQSYHKTSACTPLLDKIEGEAVAHFFLIEQRLKGSDSFWFPYINALPKADELTTPLYFSKEDLLWLHGTQQYNQNVPPERTAVALTTSYWRDNWKSGMKILQKHMDASMFTWELYKWAATIFSSRSFTSQIYGDPDDVYPVLYPVLDCFNHRFAEKVHWNMGMIDKSFTLRLAEATQAGHQVFNNYAPKTNDELLLGYGFAIENNPCDVVGMRMAPPPDVILETLRQTMPYHYKSKELDQDEFSFKLRGSHHYAGGYDNRMRNYGITCMRGIPEELALTLQLLTSFHMIPKSEDPMRKEGELWCSAIDAFLGRLHNVREQITMWDDKLPPKPQNKRQEYAKIYRDGQLKILNEIIGEFESFLAPFEQGEDFMNTFGRLVSKQHFRTYS